MDGSTEGEGKRQNGIVRSEAANAVRGRGALARLSRAAGIAFFGMACLISSGLVAVQMGLADGFLTERIRQALVATVGPHYLPKLERASIRFGADGRVAIVAQDVQFLRIDPASSPPQEPAVLTSATRVRMVLDPLPLLSGRMEPASIQIDGARFDARLAGSGGMTNWDAVRIDNLDDLTERSFAMLDRVRRTLSGGKANSFVLSGARMEGLGRPVVLERFSAGLSSQGSLVFEGRLDIDGHDLSLTGEARGQGRFHPISSLRLSAEGSISLTNEAYRRYRADAPEIYARQRFGLETDARISFAARRAPREGQAQLDARIVVSPGSLTMGGVETRIRKSRIALAYLAHARKVEILPSILNIADTRLPFSGGAIDLSNLATKSGRGIAFEAIIHGARAAPTDSAEPPLPFNGKVSASFLKYERRLVLEEIQLDSPAGRLFASSAIRFGSTSPQISFAARFNEMEAGGLKQLWPFWIANKPRLWVQENLFGGKVRDGHIEVFVPEGRIAERPGQLDLEGDQLSVGFAFSGSRLGIAGDIPPLRETSGRLDLEGSRMEVDIDSATGYFPSGRSVEVEDSVLVVPDTHARPLMAELDLNVSGEAAAAAELISYKPIAVLRRFGYEPQDFSGAIDARVSARFGLVREQRPPPPDYRVEMTLDGVDVEKPVQGHDLRSVTGELVVEPAKAELDVVAEIDGIPLDLALTRPLGAASTVEPQRTVSGTVSEAARERILPGLDGIVGGPLTIRLQRTGEDREMAEIGLDQASLTVPGLGWNKAAGIPATARFVLVRHDEGQRIENFSLTGDGFSARGEMELGAGGLRSARFGEVRLSDRDSFSVVLQHSANGAFDVDVTGSAIDLRSLIDKARSGFAGGTGEAGASPAVSVTADIGTAFGFNGESLSGFSVRYEGRGGNVRALEVRGVTPGNAAVVLSIQPTESGSLLSVNAGDLGAVARFSDLYKRLSGGILDLQLSRLGDGPYTGTVNVADFAVMDEAQLRQLLNAPAGNGRSLDEALSGRIDTSAARFERGFARLTLDNGAITVRDGVVRGPQIGMTFEGVAVDANGTMDITGTFMPAYGLNRLVAEIPLIGQILGNGRDRGLIGITFRLAGPVDDPALTVNPISAMAPGIFREIFEF